MAYLSYRVKIDLVKYLALSVLSTHQIDFSISNNENYVSGYETAYGLSLNITTSTTSLTIYAGGSSSTKTGNNVLTISATNDYVISDVSFDEQYFDEFLFFIENGVISLDVDGKTSLIVYKQNSENNKLSKNLTFVGIMYGKFNNAIGLKNVNVDIHNYGRDYNYVFIPSLNRFYYVNSIDFISADITRLHLKEDVLMSWKSLIKSQSAFVERCGNSLFYDLTIEDQEIKTDYQKEIVVDNVLLTGSALTSFYTPSTQPYVLVVVRS